MLSHPTWVRGLKRLIFISFSVVLMSHPTWVRGLKLLSVSSYIENCEVAPYVGAWIETLHHLPSAIYTASHPTWVRGLKHKHTNA